MLGILSGQSGGMAVCRVGLRPALQRGWFMMPCLNGRVTGREAPVRGGDLILVR